MKQTTNLQASPAGETDPGIYDKYQLAVALLAKRRNEMTHQQVKYRKKMKLRIEGCRQTIQEIDRLSRLIEAYKQGVTE